MECIEQLSRFIPSVRAPTSKKINENEVATAYELYVRNPEKRLEKREPFERTKGAQKLSSIYPRPSKESSCNTLLCKTFHVTRFDLNVSGLFQKNIFSSALIIIATSLLAQALI